MTTGSFTWLEFKQYVSSLVSNHVSFICRGQSNSTWKLKTSFHRLVEQNGINLEQYLNVIIPELHYHISAAQNYIFKLDDKIEYEAFLALIQHHGFPTPLLDWTYSPYIAAYFAFRDVDDINPPTEKVQIFLFDQLKWIKSYFQPNDLRDKSSYISVFEATRKV
jgi:hypothetical protein